MHIAVPHYLLFFGIPIAVALRGMITVYVFILLSKAVFSRQQAVKDDHGPTHNLLRERDTGIRKRDRGAENVVG